LIVRIITIFLYVDTRNILEISIFSSMLRTASGQRSLGFDCCAGRLNKYGLVEVGIYNSQMFLSK